ncbi:unnamed protein product [Oreochromis niloticus]|nr:unnamed protein product [Mustela putorius furo]
MTRPAFDPADSDLFERQEAALSIWTEKLKEKQRLFAEREHIFEGTRLALGGPRRRRVPPPAASPAPEHLPRRVGASRRASAAPPLAAPLLAHTPAASFAGPPISPRRSGYASHLGSMEATAPEAQLSTPAASSSRRKQRTRRHSMDHFKQLPVRCSSDYFSHSSSDSSHKTNNRLTSDSWGVSLLDDDVDWECLFCSAPPKTVQSKTVNSGGRKTRTIPDSPASITHPVTISTPITQPFPTSTVTQIRPPSSAGSPPQTTRAQPTPTPVPAPRRRAAATQSTSTPAPVSRVGVTGVQPPPVPVPAPRLRGARTQTDLPKSVEELAPPPVSSPLHPPPDPAFHALALSLVRLAEVSPAQAPALLAQAAVLSPSVIHPLSYSVFSPVASCPVSPVTHSPPIPVPKPEATASRASCELSRSSARGFRTRWPGRSSARGFRARWPGRSSARGFRARWPGRSSARGFRARCPGRSSARGFRARWPRLSPARGLRARWPRLSPARGLRARFCVAWSGLCFSFCVAWSGLCFSFCIAWSGLCFSFTAAWSGLGLSLGFSFAFAWSSFCHAVAQATFWMSTPPPSSSRPPTGPAQWPPPSSSRPPTGPAQWPPPSSSRPPTGPAQWPPPSSSRPPTRSTPASPPATWPPTGTLQNISPAAPDDRLVPEPLQVNQPTKPTNQPTNQPTTHQ